MDALEKDLALWLAESAPPAHDPAFALAVMARIERRRYRRGLALNVVIAAAAAFLLFPLSQIFAFPLQAASEDAILALLVTGIGIILTQAALQAVES